MLARQRRALILDHLDEHGGARVSDLVERLAVSPVTVRRDLQALAGRGLVSRVHGGATPTRPRSARKRAGADHELVREHEDIARAAVALVRPRTTIGLVGGPVVLGVARGLAAVDDVTVVTACVAAFDELGHERKPGRTVVLTGGVRTRSGNLVGPLSTAALAGTELDLVIVGPDGVDPGAGLTAVDPLEAQTARCFVESARRVVVLADRTVWQQVRLSSFAPLGRADVLVTSAPLGADARRRVEECVGELVVCARGGSGHRLGLAAQASLAARNPMLPDDDSGVFDERAATR
jgi:DeoR/GlpR family transcriptional regulator of sugar metabolism